MVENCEFLQTLKMDAKLMYRFVATEEGIFQYKINAGQRGQFPGISWI